MQQCNERVTRSLVWQWLWCSIVVLGYVNQAAWGQVGQPRELLTNGGFEQGAAGWTLEAQHQVLDDADAAQSGTHCLSGEVTQADRALRLVREVPVARGIAMPCGCGRRERTGPSWWCGPSYREDADRIMIASWPNLTRRWQMLTTPITVSESGTLYLELITPSSYGVPAGRIWVDDISLLETEMPTTQCITPEAGFDDEPAMAMTSDGAMYVACNRFVEQADSLQIIRLTRQETGWNEANRWQVFGGPGHYVTGICMVAAGNRVAVVYAAEDKQGDWDIRAVFCGPDGPEAEQLVSHTVGVDAKPSAYWHQGSLWVAWESNRHGTRQIFAAALREGTPGEEVPVSDPGVSSYDPSIHVLENGQVCVAWHQFEAGNYDVYLRRRDGAEPWGTPVRMTQAPTIDRHARLFGRGDDLWLIYENAQTENWNKSARQGRECGFSHESANRERNQAFGPGAKRDPFIRFGSRL